MSIICSDLQASEGLLKEHYADLSTKPFFKGLVQYMNSGPVVPMVDYYSFDFHRRTFFN